MKLRTLLTINAIIAAIFGMGFLIIPKTILSIYGGTLTDVGTILARLLGAEFLSYAAITWLARNIKETRMLRIIVPGCLIGFGLGFIVFLLAQLSGVFNFLGWSTVMVYLFFTLGYGYFYFKDPVTLLLRNSFFIKSY